MLHPGPLPPDKKHSLPVPRSTLTGWNTGDSATIRTNIERGQGAQRDMAGIVDTSVLYKYDYLLLIYLLFFLNIMIFSDSLRHATTTTMKSKEAKTLTKDPFITKSHSFHSERVQPSSHPQL